MTPTPTNCDQCGMPPMHLQKRPLVKMKKEWLCDKCIRDNATERNTLQAQLKLAIKTENYEAAAKLRDQLR